MVEAEQMPKPRCTSCGSIDTADQSSCVESKSPDPAMSPDGFGQAVGERGETNAETQEGDTYTGDPVYGDCDGR